MRRTATLVALAAALAAVVLVATAISRSSRGTGYEVKAIFDDAPVTVGSDVLVAGVPVGKVVELDVTPEHKAALTLRIDDARFTPFHADARCGNRPQSLIGERSVVCEVGTAARPALRELPDGQHLLPLERTTGAVDLDLVNAIWRQPAPQQLSILLAELGAGTATRGPELAAIIRRATPGLQQTDRFLKTLAGQTAALRRLSRDGAAALKPLAVERRRLVGFIDGSDRAAMAAADQPAALDRGLQRLAPSLRSLQSVMTQLRAFADESTPVLREVANGAPALSKATQATPSFARGAAPAIQQLGVTARRQRRDLPRLDRLSGRLDTVGGDLATPARNLAALLTSLERGNGIPNLLRSVYGAANASNGFDASGHYLRTQVLSGACGQYANKPFFGCDAQFGDAKISGAASRAPARPAAQDATGATGPSGAPDVKGVDGLLDYLLGSGR